MQHAELIEPKSVALHPPVIIEGRQLVSKTQYPVKGEGKKSKELQVSELLTHPMAGSEKGVTRDKWRYRFLRVTRYPSSDRPDSGRLLVENIVTGKRTEHYALLFNVRFMGAAYGERGA
jgi:hypothetical protein